MNLEIKVDNDLWIFNRNRLYRIYDFYKYFGIEDYHQHILDNPDESDTVWSYCVDWDLGFEWWDVISYRISDDKTFIGFIVTEDNRPDIITFASPITDKDSYTVKVLTIYEYFEKVWGYIPVKEDK